MSTPTNGIVRGLGRYDVLALTASIWFLAKFLRYAFPPLFGPFQETYGVSNTALGAAFTGFLLVYAAMQFPSGVLADRFGSPTVITWGVAVTSVAALALLLESPFVVLVLAMLVIGAGTGAHKTVAVQLLARTYPTRTGRALGFLDTFGTFGGVVAPIAVVLAASYPLLVETGWRSLFFVTGIVGLLLGAAFVRLVPEQSSENTQSSTGEDASSPTPGLRQYVTLFRDLRFANFVFATILVSVTYHGLVAFAPLYLTDEAGLTTSTAGVLYSALFAASLVQLLTGEISDRVGTLPVIVAALGLASVAMAAFVGLTRIGSALFLGVALVAVGLGMHGFRPVRGSYLMTAVPDTIAGGSLGVVRTLSMGAGAVSPVVVGYLSETVGFRTTFWLLTGPIAGATVLCAYLLATEATRFRIPDA